MLHISPIVDLLLYCTKKVAKNNNQFFHFRRGGETHFLVLPQTLIYHIKEWFGMTPTVGKNTLIVQMCVKLRVSYLPLEAGTIGHKFSFKKTELILRPVFALISQAPQKTFR